MVLSIAGLAFFIAVFDLFEKINILSGKSYQPALTILEGLFKCLAKTTSISIIFLQHHLIDELPFIIMFELNKQYILFPYFRIIQNCFSFQ